jgi:hypothetical protein
VRINSPVTSGEYQPNRPQIRKENGKYVPVSKSIAWNSVWCNIVLTVSIDNV